jgi:hypothetical protein
VKTTVLREIGTLRIHDRPGNAGIAPAPIVLPSDADESTGAIGMLLKTIAETDATGRIAEIYAPRSAAS